MGLADGFPSLPWEQSVFLPQGTACSPGVINEIQVKVAHVVHPYALPQLPTKRDHFRSQEHTLAR